MYYDDLDKSKMIDGWKRTTHNDPHYGFYNPIYLLEMKEEYMNDPFMDLLRNEHKHYCLSGFIGIRPECEPVSPVVLSFNMLSSMFRVGDEGCVYCGGNNGTVQLIYVFCLPSWNESKDLADLCSHHFWTNTTDIIDRFMTDLQPAEITDVLDAFTVQAARDISKTITSLNNLQNALDDYQGMRNVITRHIFDRLNGTEYEPDREWSKKYIHKSED